MEVNRCPGGLTTRRAGGSRRTRTVPLVVPRGLPRIFAPEEVDSLFAAVGDHLHDERPRCGTDRVFVVLKGPAEAIPVGRDGGRHLDGARRGTRLEWGTCHELRQHPPGPVAGGGDGTRDWEG